MRNSDQSSILPTIIAVALTMAVFWGGVGFALGVTYEGRTSERAIRALERCVEGTRAATGELVRADAVIQGLYYSPGRAAGFTGCSGALV